MYISRKSPFNYTIPLYIFYNIDRYFIYNQKTIPNSMLSGYRKGSDSDGEYSGYGNAQYDEEV